MIFVTVTASLGHTFSHGTHVRKGKRNFTETKPQHKVNSLLLMLSGYQPYSVEQTQAVDK